jgi:hypothetical protein
MATATRPCEKAASILTEALFKDMKAPIKEYIVEEMNKGLVRSFKTMKDDFLVEVVPKLNDIKEEMNSIIAKKGKDNVNEGVVMLMYYAASRNVGKDDINGFLAAYGKGGKELFAKYLGEPKNAALISQKKASAMEVALGFEDAVSETTFRAFSTELYKYANKGNKEAEAERSDVLYYKQHKAA